MGGTERMVYRRILDSSAKEKLAQAKVYPDGLLGELAENDLFDFRPVKRVELFAKNDRANRTYAVLRELFPAFSSDRKVLGLADSSDSIVSVHTRSEKRLSEDKLVLRRSCEPEDAEGLLAASVLRRERTPSLIVSPRWLDRMSLSNGDRVIISNPIESYTIPPPGLAAERR